jgi:hypothetical protein
LFYGKHHVWKTLEGMESINLTGKHQYFVCISLVWIIVEGRAMIALSWQDVLFTFLVWKRNEFLQIFLKTLEPSEVFYISGLITVRICHACSILIL